MLIARVQLPDGRIARFEVAEGTPPADIEAAAARMFAPKAPTAFERGLNNDSPVTQGLVSAMQGPTFGFSDEIAGGVESLLTGRPYADTRDEYRGMVARQAKDFPVANVLTQLATSAPLMAVGGPLGAGRLTAPTMLGRTGQAAAVGGVQGVVRGAGESRADSASGIAKDAAMGGATSAVLSGAVVPVQAAVSGMARTVASNFRPSTAEQYARGKVAEAFARDSTLKTPTMTQPAARMRTLGDEARAVDAGGENVRQLLDTQAMLPGRTKQAAASAIRQRQAGRGDRLISAAEREMNPSGLRLSDTIDDLIARREEAARPLYAKLYRRSIKPDAELTQIVAAAQELGADKVAQRIATARQQPFTLEPNAQRMSMADLDRLKQGLDDIIQGSIDQTGKMNKVGAAVVDLKMKLTAKLDGLTKGAYAQARQAFAGPAQLIDAAQTGRRALSMDAQAIAKAMQGMTDGESEAYRLGAFEALRAKLGTQSGQTQVMNLWREKTTRDKLKALFGSERAFRTFASRVGAESRMRGIESVGRGSQTASRQFAAGDLDVDAIESARQGASAVASGNIPAMLGAVARQWNKVQTPEPVRDRIGQLLLQRGAQGRATLAELEQMLRRINDERARWILGAGAAAPVVNPLMPPQN